ncbi:MAG: YtfJ family protein [Polyangiales bacterium]
MHLVLLALLKIGALAGDFTVKDADDHVSTVSVLRAGGPALVVYEDKDASEENARFKERLGKLRDKDAAAKKVKLIAIADVASWDFWPANGFVKDALRDASKKSGITVWADWSAAGRTALDAQRSRSNLVLVDGSGKVLWSSAGALSTAQEDDLLARIRAAGS